MTTQLNDLMTPIKISIENYLSRNPIRLHVPFHNGLTNNNFLSEDIYNLDISEITGLDATGKNNPVYKSEKITANFFNVEHSFYLTNGASSGLFASMLALNKIGKKVIISRNVHKSVINGLVLSGLEPVWLDVDFVSEWEIFSSVNLASFEKMISEIEELAGCIIVSPTYEGIVSDIRAVSKLCHLNGIPLIVDEAHGAHFHLLDEYESAIECGADIVIQSWHKSFGSLTQSGVLHLVNETFLNYWDIKRSIDLVTSTSPSFLLLLSLELTRKYISESGIELFNYLINQAQLLKKDLSQIKGIQCYEVQDPFKIYLKHEMYSGLILAEKLLEDYSIEVESANSKGVLLYIGRSLNGEISARIISAFKDVCQSFLQLNALENQSCAPTYKKFKLNPRKAFLHANISNVESEINAPCPPGYAITVPGTVKD